MYSLLVTAESGAWDGEFYEFWTSRFLEYTNEKIAEAFKSLDSEQIELLKSLPCLFAYEGTEAEVRVGRLKSIKDRGRNLLIEWEFDQGIPPIPFSEIEPIAPLLDIRDWEMNRTHWAIKDEDLFARLEAAQIIGGDVAGESSGSIGRGNLPKKKKSGPTVSTVRGFIDKVFEEQGDDDHETFYRGHSNKAKYKLEPSLFRRDSEGNYVYLHNEHILYRELLVSNSADFVGDVYTLDRLIRMQHFSLPTRLLDITSNPLIALYFACKSRTLRSASDRHRPEVAGEVVLFSVRKDQVKYFDSDTGSCIANLARLPRADKEAIDFELSREAFDKQQSVKRLVHFIREEKSFFEANIDPQDLREIICIKGKKSNDRISSQSGAFLLFGLDAILDEKGTGDIRVTRIAVTNKGAILAELDLLNINESTVFPYIENSAKYVAQKYAFGGSG